MSGAVLAGTVLLTFAACGDDGGSPAPTESTSPQAGNSPVGTSSTTTTSGDAATVTTTVTVAPGDGDGGAGGPGDDGTDPTVDRCHTSDLTVSLTGGDAGAGSVYYTVDFRNTSDRDCTVAGYPGVSLVGGGDGTQIGAPAERDSAGESATVTLAPGTSAVTQLQATNPENYGDRCEVVSGDGLRIYPPDELDSTYVAAPDLRGCVNDSITTLRVRPLTAS